MPPPVETEDVPMQDINEDQDESNVGDNHEEEVVQPPEGSSKCPHQPGSATTSPLSKLEPKHGRIEEPPQRQSSCLKSSGGQNPTSSTSQSSRSKSCKGDQGLVSNATGMKKLGH